MAPILLIKEVIVPGPQQPAWLRQIPRRMRRWDEELQVWHIYHPENYQHIEAIRAAFKERDGEQLILEL
jgi:hypothetical protein